MPARPASWKTIRNRFNQHSRELYNLAHPERTDKPLPGPDLLCLDCKRRKKKMNCPACAELAEMRRKVREEIAAYEAQLQLEKKWNQTP